MRTRVATRLTTHGPSELAPLYAPFLLRERTSASCALAGPSGNQTPEDFAAGTRMNEHAERDGFLIAYPEQPRSASVGRLWNWQQPSEQHRDRGEPALIAGITRQVMDAHRVATDAVYVAGLSAGGAMALILATTYPDLFTAAGVHSGVAYGSAHNTVSGLAVMHTGGWSAPPDLTHSCPVIVVHGGRDRTVNAINADRIVHQVAATLAGTAEPAQVTTMDRVTTGRAHTRTDYRDPRGRLVVQDWRAPEGTHAWNGGSPDGTYTDPHGPDATTAMVHFFALVRSGR